MLGMCSVCEGAGELLQDPHQLWSVLRSAKNPKTNETKGCRASNSMIYGGGQYIPPTEDGSGHMRSDSKAVPTFEEHGTEH